MKEETDEIFTPQFFQVIELWLEMFHKQVKNIVLNNCDVIWAMHDQYCLWRRDD